MNRDKKIAEELGKVVEGDIRVGLLSIMDWYEKAKTGEEDRPKPYEADKP